MMTPYQVSYCECVDDTSITRLELICTVKLLLMLNINLQHAKELKIGQQKESLWWINVS